MKRPLRHRPDQAVLEVTAADLFRGWATVGACPIALAARRLFGRADCWFDGDYLWVGAERYWVIGGWNFAAEFDAEGEVGPKTFRLKKVPTKRERWARINETQ